MTTGFVQYTLNDGIGKESDLKVITNAHNVYKINVHTGFGCVVEAHVSRNSCSTDFLGGALLGVREAREGEGLEKQSRKQEVASG